MPAFGVEWGKRAVGGAGMTSFLSRYKNLLVLVIVLVVQIIGLGVQARRPRTNRPDSAGVRLLRSGVVHLIVPPERLVHGTTGGISGLWSNYLDLRNVRRENANLRAQVVRLQMEQAALLEDARQGQRLEKLLEFREHYIYKTIPAQVIGTSGSDQSHVLYIDKGSADGLKPDMAVVTADGIVGKLRDVFRHTSQVLEISDQSSGAGVLLTTTRLQGILRGDAVGQPEIVNLLPDERVKAGEQVITSGGDQIFPRGLPVGVVERVVPDVDNPAYVNIIVKPAAKLGHIEEVLVITSTSPQMTLKAKQDIAASVKAAAAAEAASAPAQPARAADILAERLPGLSLPLNDPNPPATATDVPQPVTAVLPLHSDRFTPGATPPAADMVPGKQFVPLPVAVPPPPPAAPAKPAAAAPAGQQPQQPPAGLRQKTASQKPKAASGKAIKPASGPQNRSAEATAP